MARTRPACARRHLLGDTNLWCGLRLSCCCNLFRCVCVCIRFMVRNGNYMGDAGNNGQPGITITANNTSNYSLVQPNCAQVVSCCETVRKYIVIAHEMVTRAIKFGPIKLLIDRYRAEWCALSSDTCSAPVRSPISALRISQAEKKEAQTKVKSCLHINLIKE